MRWVLKVSEPGGGAPQHLISPERRGERCVRPRAASPSFTAPTLSERARHLVGGLAP